MAVGCVLVGYAVGVVRAQSARSNLPNAVTPTTVAAPSALSEPAVTAAPATPAAPVAPATSSPAPPASSHMDDGAGAETQLELGEEEGEGESEGYDSDELANVDGVAAANVRCKMVILCRKDLGMGPGKLAAQVGHACVKAVAVASRHTPAHLVSWQRRGAAKICLKVNSEQEILTIMATCEEVGLVCAPIRDAGHTQVAPNTLTVMAVFGPEELVSAATGHLKLF